MFDRFQKYVGSKPRSAVAIILTLSVAILLVLSGTLIYISGVLEPPYPNEKLISMELKGGRITLTQDLGRFEGYPYNYSEMRIALRIYDRAGGGTASQAFGNQSALGGNSYREMTERIWDGGSMGVEVNYTIQDFAGNGSFDYGDKLILDIIPLRENLVYTLGLHWNHTVVRDDKTVGGLGMSLEYSFAIHDGRLYKWFSDLLPTEEPWYG